MTAAQKPVQEWVEGNSMHRLVSGEQTTEWASYSSWTYLNGYVGFTAYYGITEGVMTADEFCKMTGVE